MEPFVAIIHILVAVILIALVLVQDSKSGSLGGAFGGGGSNSVLGATGAATLAQKLTRWAAIFFAATSITLTFFATRSHKSVMEGVVVTPPAPVSAPAVPAAETPSTAAPADATPATK
jgi:preprotein translocase subunit SecG